MAKYRKKPVVIEAYQYEGDFISNGKFIAPSWIKEALDNEVLVYKEKRQYTSRIICENT